MSQLLTKAGLRRTACFAIMLGCFVLLILRSDGSAWLDRFSAPLNVLTARTTAAVIGWCGLSVQRELAVLIHGGFICEIYYACTGLIPATILVLAILTFPARLQHKLIGLLIAVPALFLVNLVRLVSVFFIGVYYPGAFYVVHTVVWNVVWIAFLAWVFVCWLRWMAAQNGLRRYHCAVRGSDGCPTVVPHLRQ